MKKVLVLLVLAFVLVACGSKGDSTGLKDGTHKGEATGYKGAVEVEVVVADGKITKVTITGDEETPEVGQAAFEKLEAAIIEKQSADIDVVTGATVTSKAVIKAVEEALK